MYNCSKRRGRGTRGRPAMVGTGGAQGVYGMDGATNEKSGSTGSCVAVTVSHRKIQTPPPKPNQAKPLSISE
uniref:Uncharacterized protein n=1 Tax=Oryza glumipatula TaxID=40148 RepID=A0A0D9Z465_9ORYZ